MENLDLNNINDEIISSIHYAREERALNINNIISRLSNEHKILYRYKTYDINHLLSLCINDYRELITILITKKIPEDIRAFTLINRFSRRPLFFIILLAYHPDACVKINGITKIMIMKILRRNKNIFNFARKIYYKVRG